MNSEVKWVSDLIGDEYQEWSNDLIFFGIGTGRGKTRFSLEIYCPWLIQNGCKKILYLCNRVKLKEQVTDTVESVGKDDVNVGELSDNDMLEDAVIQESLKPEIAEHVTVQTYQWLIFILNHSGMLPEYDAIIADEVHFLLSDASFNIYTDMAYNYIIEQNCPVIFMTATYKVIFEWIQRDIIKRGLERKQWKYFLDTDYNYVEKVVWFDQKHLYGIIDSILRDTDDKFLYFINSVTKMQKVYEHYKPDGDSSVTKKYQKYLEDAFINQIDFQCSKHTGNKWGQAINRKYSNVFAEGEDGGITISNRGLVATKFIDNGIDFKDHKIRHIICDILDPETAIQCLGRKRVLDANDRCTFYLRNYKNTGMTVFVENAQKNLESPNLFLEDKNAWMQKYDVKRGYADKTVYKDGRTGCYYLNEMRYYKLLWDLDFVSGIQDGTIDFKEVIMDYLGDTVACEDAVFYQMEKVKSILGFFLEDHKDVPLNKTAKEDLVDLCKLKDRWGRLQKSVGLISQYVEENFGYTVESKQQRKNGNRERVWIIHEAHPP